jgi:hypothetical protein
LANPNAYSSSFSDDDEDTLMIKHLDYKLGARKASASKSETLKTEKKKSRKVIVEEPLMVDGAASGNH